MRRVGKIAGYGVRKIQSPQAILPTPSHREAGPRGQRALHALACYATPLHGRVAHPTVVCMMSVEDIERAISELSSTELDRFCVWFETFDAQRFNERIEQNAQTGKLDRIADEALAEHRAGRTREL